MRSLVLGTCVLVVLICCTCACLAQGPVQDTFYSSFIMGRYRDPGSLVLQHGYPADLWRPVLVDTIWIADAVELLEARKDFEDPVPLIPTWLKLDPPFAGLGVWADGRRRLLAGLSEETWKWSGKQLPAGPLPAALQAVRFFEVLAAGDTLAARDIALELADHGGEGRDDPARRFIWDLRARALGDMTGVQPEDPDDPWPLLYELGPYDRQSGWVLWAAHRRQLRLPLLGPGHGTRRQAAALANLRASGLSSEDLDHSGFTYELKAGLGAVVLKGRERRDFMARFRQPPWDFQAQGWWVRGSRQVAGGRADRYEEMARDSRLRSGWRMDLWRRASERRLLAGDWTRGLADLRRAVGLARYQAGSPALRRRVRQWAEQALALAVASDDSARSRAIYELGAHRLPLDEQADFRRRTAAWYPGAGSSDAGEEAEEAAWKVRAGEAGSLVDAEAALPLPESGELRLAAWHSWASACMSLPGEGADDSLLLALQEEEDPARARRMALVLIAHGLDDASLQADLWDEILMREVFLRRRVGSRASWSLYPGLKKLVRAEPARIHSWLGLALALQDLRAVVGLMGMAPSESLPLADKLHFLYPVPAFGPVRRALEQARSEAPLLLAVARNESLFDPGARSRAGALGWMQIMPFHYGGEAGTGTGHWADPSVSIAKGDALLEKNRRRYHGNPYTVLAAYNAGPRAAERWWDQLGGNGDDGLYLAWIGYPETRLYVEKVLKDRLIYAGILAPEDSPGPARGDGP